MRATEPGIKWSHTKLDKTHGGNYNACCTSIVSKTILLFTGFSIHFSQEVFGTLMQY